MGRSDDHRPRNGQARSGAALEGLRLAVGRDIRGDKQVTLWSV
jgi:hypothetical protein